MKKKVDNSQPLTSQVQETRQLPESTQMTAAQIQAMQQQNGNKIQIGAQSVKIPVQGAGVPPPQQQNGAQMQPQQNMRPNVDMNNIQQNMARRPPGKPQGQEQQMNPEMRNTVNPQGQLNQQIPMQNMSIQQQMQGHGPNPQQQIPPQMQNQMPRNMPMQGPPNGQQMPPNQAYRYPPGQGGGQYPPQGAMGPQGQYPQMTQGQPPSSSQYPPMAGSQGIPPQQYPQHQSQMYPMQGGAGQMYGPGMSSSMYALNQQQQQMYQQIQKFDSQVITYVQSITNERADIAGIQVEMPRFSLQPLVKNYNEFLKRSSPQDKLKFLENTLLKRKSLINKNSKKYKAIMKKQLKQKQKSGLHRQKVKCPVYKCFKELDSDDQLIKHYAEAHQDLKALGLDLIMDGSNMQQLASGRSIVKGKITNTLLTQAFIISLQHKNLLKDMLQELNEEVPLLE